MMTRILIVIALLVSSMSVWNHADQFKAAFDLLDNQPYGFVYISIGPTGNLHPCYKHSPARNHGAVCTLFRQLKAEDQTGRGGW